MAKDRTKKSGEQGDGGEHLNKEEIKRAEIEQKKFGLLGELKEARAGLVHRQSELFQRNKGAEELAASIGKLLDEMQLLQHSIENLDLASKIKAVEKNLKAIKEKVSQWSDRVEQAFADYDELMKELASSEAPSPDAETPSVESRTSPDMAYGSGLLNFNETILNFNPLLEKGTCDIRFENSVLTLAGKDKFANLYAEVSLGENKKSLRVKIMRGPKVEYEQPAESAISAKMILEDFFTKKPDMPDAAAAKSDDEAKRALTVDLSAEPKEPPAIDEAAEKKALGHAKTVLAGPEEEPASKEITEKFVLENGEAKVGDIAIDLGPLVNSGNYKIELTKNGTVEITDINDANYGARFQFDKDEKKIAFQKMNKGRLSKEAMLASEAVLPQLQYLFPELRPAIRPPFKFEGGVLTAEDFSWDLNSILDSEKCDVSLTDNIVIFQGKGELAKIKIEMKVGKDEGEVRLKKGDDVKQFKIENAKNYLERIFAKEKKKVEVKKPEPKKVEPAAAVDTAGEASQIDYLAGVITEERLNKLIEILNDADLEMSDQEKEDFKNMATTLSVGLPPTDADSDVIKSKRALFSKDDFAYSLKKVEDHLLRVYEEGALRGGNISRKKKWYKKVEKYLGVKSKEERKFDAETMPIYRRLHDSFDEVAREVEDDKIILLKTKSDPSKSVLVDVYNQRMAIFDRKLFLLSEELENTEDGDKLKERESYFNEKIEECKKELRAIMVAFDHEQIPVADEPAKKPKAETTTGEPKKVLINEFIAQVKGLEANYINFIDSCKVKDSDFYARAKEESDKLRVEFADMVIKAKKMTDLDEAGRFLAKQFENIYKYLDNRMKEHRSAIDKFEKESAGGVDVNVDAEVVAPAKKSIWQRAKEKFGRAAKSIISRTAAETAYKTAASIFGVKTLTDIAGFATGAIGRGLAKKEIGFGDINKMYTSYREKKGEKSAIQESLKEVFEGGEKIDEKINDLRSKIESSKHISAKDRKALLENLQRIAADYQSAENKATEERDKKVSALLKIYMKNKVSAMTLAKDALNTALTLSGMAMVRGAAYATLSVGERMVKANTEFEKSKVGLAPNVRRSRTKFLLKDLTVGVAVETGRSLVFMGAKKKTEGVGRVVDFMKAFGTLARGFGIYGLAITDSMNPEEAMQAFIEKVQEQGINCTVKDNFINNAERVIQLYTHPIDTISGQSAGQAPAAKEIHHDAEVTSAAAVPVAEQISPELKSYLDQFGGSPSAREAFLAGVHSGHSPEEVADAFVVHKGDGLERIIQRQLLLDPEKYGMHDQNILHDAGKLHQWAGHEARVIAVKNHLDDKYLIFNVKHPQHLVVNADGKIDLSGAGKLHHQSEIDAVRARVSGEAASHYGKGPVDVKEVFDIRTGEPKIFTDAEQVHYQILENRGAYDEAMKYMMDCQAHGSVFELPDGTEVHGDALDFAREASGGASASDITPETHVPETQNIEQELKTPEIFREEGQITGVDESAMKAVDRAIETAKKYAGEDVVGEGAASDINSEYTFIRAESGAIVDFNHSDNGEPIGIDIVLTGNEKFGNIKEALLNKDVGAQSFSQSQMDELAKIGAADDVYRHALNQGEQNSTDAVYLKEQIANRMTELSKSTGEDRTDLFKAVALKRYGFSEDAAFADNMDTASRYAGL